MYLSLMVLVLKKFVVDSKTLKSFFTSKIVACRESFSADIIEM